MPDNETNTSESEEAVAERRDPITILGINANGHLLVKTDTTAGYTLRINNQGHLEVVYSE